MILTERLIADALYLERFGSDVVLAPCYTPDGWYECDIYALTRAGYAVEFEIKLTLSDFRADAKKCDDVIDRQAEWTKLPGGGFGAPRTTRRKHDRLAVGDPKGPSRFFYVVPEGLLEPHQVPAWAGLIIARARQHSRRPHLWQIKAAPKLHRTKPDAEAVVRQLHGRLYHRYWQMRTRGPQADLRPMPRRPERKEATT